MGSISDKTLFSVDEYMHYERMFGFLQESAKEAYEEENGEGSWEDYDPTEY